MARKKCVEERVEVAVVEGPDGLHVEHVSLCLTEGAVDGLPVVELLGEADYLGTDEDVAARDGLAEVMPSSEVHRLRAT